MTVSSQLPNIGAEIKRVDVSPGVNADKTQFPAQPRPRGETGSKGA